MQGDFGFYTIRPNENYSDGVLNMRGRFDLANRTYINYGADYQRLTAGGASLAEQMAWPGAESLELALPDRRDAPRPADLGD